MGGGDWRRGDDDPGGPNDAVAELVALLDDVDHRALLGLGRLRQQRLVDVRVELPVRLDRLHPVPLEQAGQRAMDELDAFLELRLLVLLGSRESPLEIVEDRDQLGDQPLVREPDVLLALAGRSLLVVLEIGGEAQQPVVLLRLRLLLLDLLGLVLLVVLDLLLGHEVGASSSTTSYSPSSTTSSSEAGSPSPPPAEACACCAASA